jgi:aquaporin NIP
MPGRTTLLYAFAQALGAVAASLLLRACFPAAPGYGATAPAPGVRLLTAFGFEGMLTLHLMFAILGVSHGAREEGVVAALAIGATVGLCAFFGGAVTGASMKPARSLGPALVSGQLGELWLYLLAPPLGA